MDSCRSIYSNLHLPIIQNIHKNQLNYVLELSMIGSFCLFVLERSAC
jgi:hypothetical protein